MKSHYFKTDEKGTEKYEVKKMKKKRTRNPARLRLMKKPHQNFNANNEDRVH